MNRTTGVWKNLKFSELQDLNGGDSAAKNKWIDLLLNKIFG